jgi:hypothetical protein
LAEAGASLDARTTEGMTNIGEAVVMGTDVLTIPKIRSIERG